MEARAKRQWSTMALIVAVIVGIIIGVAGGGALFFPCGTAAVVAGVTPVPAGAVGRPAPPGGVAPAIPAGATCGGFGGLLGGGDTCTAAGAGCGAFKAWTCTDTYNVNTSVCSCECM